MKKSVLRERMNKAKTEIESPIIDLAIKLWLMEYVLFLFEMTGRFSDREFSEYFESDDIVYIEETTGYKLDDIINYVFMKDAKNLDGHYFSFGFQIKSGDIGEIGSIQDKLLKINKSE